jgi:hypothetical protein
VPPIEVGLTLPVPPNRPQMARGAFRVPLLDPARQKRSVFVEEHALRPSADS